MPSQDKLDSIVDFGAIAEEQKRLADIVDGMIKHLKSAPKIKIGIEGAAGVKDLSKENARLAESIKAVDQLQRQRFATEAKLITLQTDYARATAANRVEIQKSNKELKDQAAAELAVIGSRDRALAQIKVLTAQKDKLNLLNEQEKKQYDEIVVKIEKYDSFLKKTGTSAEKQRANIGNYSGAINVLKGSLDEIAKKMDQQTKAGKANSDVMKALEKEYAILNQLVNSQAAGFATAASEIKENQKALLQMEQAGLRGTKAFNDLALATGKLKDDVADLKQRTKNLGSDSFVFDGLIQGAQSLAGAYGVAQGAAALFGNENEELQKTFVKLQAIMTVIQGLQAIQTGLQKESAFVLFLQSARTKVLLGLETLRNFVMKGTIAATSQSTLATQANTGAMTATTVATRASTASMVGLRFAFIASGIGLFLILLTSAAKGMGAFGSSTDDATASLDNLNESLEETNRQLEQVVENANFQGELLINQIKKRGGTEKEVHDQTIKNIEEEQNKRYGAYLANKKQLEDLESRFKKDQAEAAKIGITIDDNDFQEKIKPLKDNAQKNFDAAQAKLREKQKAQSDFEVKQADDQRKKDEENLKRGEDAAKKAADKRKQLQEEAARRAEEYSRRELAARIEIIRSGFEEEKKIAKENVDNEKLSQEIRLQNLSRFAKASQALIDFEKNTITGDSSKTPAEKALAEQKAAFATADLQKQISTSAAAVLEANAEKIAKAYEEAYARMDAAAKASFQGQLDKLDTDKNNKLQDLNAQLRNGDIKSVEEFEEKKKQIENEAALERLSAEVINLAARKLNRNLTAEELLAIEKELSDKTLEASNLETELHLSNDEKRKQSRAELLDTILTYEQKAAEVVSAIIVGGNTREKNRVQEQIDLNAEKSRRDIDAVNASADTEEKKAARIAIIQARAASDKERLERRQRQLDIERAKFEKAFGISQIIINTLVEVIKAGGPLTPKGLQLSIFGALALIKAIATPIPKFAKGTDNAPKGMALTGEEGHELVVPKSGKPYLTPSKPTLMQLAGGEKIFPADVTMDILRANNLLHILQNVQSGKNAAPVYENFFSEKAVRLLDKIADKAPVQLHIHPSWEGSPDWLRQFKY